MNYVDNNDLADPAEVKNNAVCGNGKLGAYEKLKKKTISEIPYFKLILEMASEQSPAERIAQNTLDSIVTFNRVLGYFLCWRLLTGHLQDQLEIGYLVNSFVL